MSEVRRILPQLRLACLLSGMMLATTAGDLEEYLLALESLCETPSSIGGVRILPPLVTLRRNETEEIIAEMNDQSLLRDWSVSGERLGFYSVEETLRFQIPSVRIEDLTEAGETRLEFLSERKNTNSVRLAVTLVLFQAAFRTDHPLEARRGIAASLNSESGTSLSASFRIVPLVPKILIPHFQRVVFNDREMTVGLQLENLSDAESCTWTRETEGQPEDRIAQKLDFENNKSTGASVEIKIKGPLSLCSKDFHEQLLVTCADISFSQKIRFHNVCTG